MSENKTSTVQSITLQGDQAAVVAHLLKAQPQLIKDDPRYGGDQVYLLDIANTGESLMASFDRWGNHHLTQTDRDNEDRIRASRVTFGDGGFEKMDALCAAWIQFRCKYLVPQEPKKQTEDDLGDLNDHPF